MHPKPMKRFVVVFEPLPGLQGDFVYLSLKRLLKAAGRAYRLKCVDAREIRPNGPQGGSKACSGQKGGRS